MGKLTKIGLKLLSKAVMQNAKNEANSACIWIGYQPRMPEKVKGLKNYNGKNC